MNEDKMKIKTGAELKAELSAANNRANVLSVVILRLRDIVTHDGESKAEFIAMVKNILGSDPDEELANHDEEIRKQEREICAKVCDMNSADYTREGAEVCAAEIRERSNARGKRHE